MPSESKVNILNSPIFDALLDRPALKEEYKFKFAIGGLNHPNAVTVDARGNLYVTESFKNQVQVLQSDGKFIYSFPSAGEIFGLLDNPSGLAFDMYGNVVVVDRKNHRVQLYDPSGRFLRSFGAEGDQPGEFKTPCDAALDIDGNIIISDWGNRRVQVFSPSGEWIRTIGEVGYTSIGITTCINMCKPN